MDDDDPAILQISTLPTLGESPLLPNERNAQKRVEKATLPPAGVAPSLLDAAPPPPDDGGDPASAAGRAALDAPPPAGGRGCCCCCRC